MNYCILTGSPKQDGNTAALLGPFMEELKNSGAQVECLPLHPLNIAPCTGCGICQNVHEGFGCPIQDDMHAVFNKILQADCLVLATPIYSWYCPAPMKAALDRLVYGMNKYYGEKPGISLWQGKKVAAITTCGYKPDFGSDLFEEGLRRYCRHSHLDYLTMLTVRDMGDKEAFRSAETIRQSREFAKQIMGACARQESL